jgi:tetratricopeptide (TPR) repeat protein
MKYLGICTSIAMYLARLVTVSFLVGGTLEAGPQRREDLVHFEQGRALFEEHDDSGEALQEAENEFNQALKLNPKLAEAVAYLGFIAAERDHLEAAEAAYHKALEIDSRSPEAHVGLAWLCQRSGKAAEALNYLRKAAVNGPNNRLALNELATSLSNEFTNPTLSMYEESISYWRTLIRLDRDARGAHQGLAGAYRHLGKWRDAELEFREVLRIGQTSEDMDVWVYSVHREVAEMLERQGKFSEAIQEYRALIASEGAGDYEIGEAKSRITRLEGYLRRK